MRSLILFLTLFIFCGSCKRASVKREQHFLVDSTIIPLAKKHVQTDNFININEPTPSFMTKWTYLGFTEDSLKSILKDSVERFAGEYYVHNDSIEIAVTTGDLGGHGFYALMKDGKVNVFFSTYTDGYPMYKLKKGDEAVPWIKVPCSFSRLIISELPTINSDGYIYGYVELKSDNYFDHSGGKDHKHRVELKLYFRSLKYRPRR